MLVLLEWVLAFAGECEHAVSMLLRGLRRGVQVQGGGGDASA